MSLIDLIYNTPPSILRASLTVVGVTFLVVGSLCVKRYMPIETKDSAAIIGLSATVAVIYAMFFGFIILATINNFNNAQEAEINESVLIEAINYESSILSYPINKQLHDAINRYVQAVLHDEWPAARTGRINTAAALPLNQFMQLLVQYKPHDAAETAIWSNLIRRATELRSTHHLRIDSSSGSFIGATTWGCLIGATIVMLISNLFFLFHNRKVHYILLFCIGSAVGALLFLEISLDSPYRGYSAIKASHIEETTNKF